MALLLLVVASAVAAPSDRGREQMAPVAASHQPQSPGTDEPEDEVEDQDDEDAEGGAPSDELLARLVERLAAAGVTTDAETIAELAARYGVGGAVRLLAWAQESGLSTDELAARFDDGAGWGQIGRDLDLHPGIGAIMGNGGPDHQAHGQGLGRAGAPGQQDR